MQCVWPLPLLPRALAVPLGAPLVVVAMALFSLSVARFRAAGTPVPARKPTTAIVRTGPYRFSRNPIYVAFSLLQLGIAIWANSPWLLATLAGAVALIHRVVIPREERYLERRFGARYLEYKASVRRWL
jgi:protein-S-isoprenylcysteine O-methyltransferase Ste14